MRAIDLFCGCGAFSLGFLQAGMEVVLGVDNDKAAINTYKRNLPGKTLLADLSEISGKDLLELVGGRVEVVMGGPPCQGFSNSNSKRSADDPRNNLIFEFLRLVEEIKPDLFIMENVPAMRTIGKGKVWNRFCESLEKSQYEWDWKILNAVDYGVPQNRKRIFVAGWSPKKIDFKWPVATHGPEELAYEPDLFGNVLEPYVNVMEAIADLPPIPPGWPGSDKMNPDGTTAYMIEPLETDGKLHNGYRRCPNCGRHNMDMRKNCHNCGRINTTLILPSDIGIYE